MSNTMHEKEKVKGKPVQQLGCFMLLIKSAIAISALGILLACAYYTALMWPYFFRPTSYSAEDIAATCKLLDLPPESAFCTSSGRQTREALGLLKADLERVYHPGSTTIDDVNTHFKQDFRLWRYSYINLSLPWVTLEIEFDKEGYVVGYGFTDEEGNTYRLTD